MENNCNCRPLAFVKNLRKDPVDDHWGDVVSEIRLEPDLPTDCLQGITDFSHLEIIYQFNRVKEEEIVYASRHPRDNPHWPKVGIFAQRGRVRPNRIGLCTVQLVRCEGRSLFVKGLDAIDGTPVLDIKPVMKEFLPREEVRQPQWSVELMRNYW